MGEQIARAVGAGGPTTVLIAGKECTVRPLGIRELTEVERDCVQRYKRAYLETFASNADLLPEAVRQKTLEEKMEAVARWDVDDLPPKHAHDPERIKLTDGVRGWLAENMEVKPDAKDLHLRRMAATALDQGTLSAGDYTGMADGLRPPRVKVPYVNWWITASYDGMVTFVWVCFRHNGVTREQVADELGRNLSLLVELTRDIEKLSVPEAGNG